MPYSKNSSRTNLHVEKLQRTKYTQINFDQSFAQNSVGQFKQSICSLWQRVNKFLSIKFGNSKTNSVYGWRKVNKLAAVRQKNPCQMSQD
ncbi:hypothetical protein BpHYR1_019002 [Brachionus plicatilis]|uniref:Uncharacterized protein n=1 Tax=Brachionus plicatilis TaxID=10195 RepID=A0A3M7RRB8_BRAPC|nr:hypothetical protein BpHYR1_019002 [Brachionus plicatilis]